MKKTSIKVLTALAITLVLAAIFFYVTLPSINIYDQNFWIFVLLSAVCFCVVFSLLNAKYKSSSKTSKKNFLNFKENKVLAIGIIVAIIPVVVMLVGNIASSTFFNAAKYSSIIEVPEAVFEDDMPETAVVNNIALMDSESAAILGKRALGELVNADLESQFQIGDTYSQINLNNSPAKVGNLEYADFFRWFNNRSSGVPGYVWVDPVDSNYKYIAFDKPMKYVDSAYFGDDLQRKLRFSYPTKIFGQIKFEVDDNGTPYYIVSCMAPKVGLFGAMDVSEVIIFNPVDGTSQLCSVANTPSWVDNVFDGYLASQKYDWYGTLQQGYWNSVIGQKNCKVTTDDFGYIVRDDDVWYFTGVTSVTNDESNIGFIISNARTGEYKFYPVIGAEEYSAMRAAEGEVQEKGYVASFPSLINVSGEATYIMVLKDSGGLVKLYALVNVEKYSIVATGSTQTEAKQEYIKLLKQNGLVTDEVEQQPVVETKTADVTVEDVRIVVSGGESIVYISGSDGNLYKQSVSADESVMLIDKGEALTLTYSDTDVEKIKQITEWKIKVSE